MIVITISHTKDNGILLNFSSIYLILWLTLYSFLEYMSCDLKMVQKQRPKHVVSLSNKTTKPSSVVTYLKYIFLLCIQGGPKVGIQPIVYYCIPTFGPPCMNTTGMTHLKGVS